MAFLRVLGRILLVLVLLLVAVYAWAYVASNGAIHKKYSVTGATLALPSDSASLAEGERLANIYGCYGCHGNKLQGQVLINDPAFGRFVCPNLTHGKGGVAATLKPEDWERAVRGGVKPDGTPVLIMPCADFHVMSDHDLALVIAHLQTAPNQDSELPANAPGPIARILIATGQYLPAAAKIDPATPHSTLTPAVTKEYGEYMSYLCRDCHGANLAGGEAHGAGPAPPNITPGGALAKWTYEDFEKAVRHGLTPEGRKLAEDMPWQYFSRMTDTEVQALWEYVKTVPAVAPKKS